MSDMRKYPLHVAKTQRTTLPTINTKDIFLLVEKGPAADATDAPQL
jgi:hypothetical protein